MHQTDIFVVDDESFIAQTLGVILRRAGYRTEVFDDPHVALLRLGRPPKLILTDHAMPGISGCAMASLFLHANPAIGVLLFSASLLDTDLEWQFVRRQTSRSRLLAKPLHPGVLLPEVESMLGLPERRWPWRDPYPRYQHVDL